ncbi:SRPBCC family protein [Streptomyces sp. NBC_01352]|uniref:SRPBCC family protein n=1 Tax=Streptomyces plumbiresistens TaxID=511811 RepID=A0ABP7RJ69_9ACTN|nr:MULTISPECIES: SRPBCC family protein [unclassified Streptomyces]MCX4703719.1 SRPBCC family protein [Streptomyces sp. NBC_01373]
MLTTLLAKAAAVPVALVTCLSGGTPAAHQQAGIDLDAPVITRDDIVIHAPLDRIWQIQTDVEAWPAWQPDVTEVTKETPGPLRAGSVFRWSVHGLQDITSTVKQVSPERRIVWGGPAQGITAVHVWTFHQKPDGVHVHTEESWSGDPVEADTPALQAALDASLDAWLHNLKEEAESRRAGRP